MDKAEKRAFEVYPVKRFYYTEDHYIPTSRDDGYEYYTQEVRDENLKSREKFLEGYRTAEKDLELTWEDMKTIIELDGNVGECDDFHGSQKYYEKVLEIFKEKKYGKRIHA